MTTTGRERLVMAGATATCVVAVLAMVLALTHPTPIASALAASAARPSPTAPVAHRPAVAAAAGGRLRVTLWAHGPGRRSRSWDVTCPGRSRACQAALAHLDALRAGALGASCGQGDGSGAEAIVNGTLRGRAIDTWLDVRDSCDQAAWRALAPLLRAPR